MGLVYEVKFLMEKALHSLYRYDFSVHTFEDVDHKLEDLRLLLALARLVLAQWLELLLGCLVPRGLPKGLPNDLAMRGLPNDLAMRGLRNDLAMRGLANDLAMRGLPNDLAMRGLPDDLPMLLKNLPMPSKNLPKDLMALELFHHSCI